MERPVFIGSATAACLIAQQIGGKAARDTLFLSSAPATDLPQAMFLAAFASLAAAGPIAFAMRRYGPRAVVPILLAASGLLFVCEWLAIERWPVVVGWLLFMHTSVFGMSVISGFWSVVNERFDPHEAKRVTGKIVAGSTLGGILGGLLAERTAALFGPSATLLVLAGLNVIACPTTMLLSGPRQPTRRPLFDEPARPAAPSLTGYLATVALLSLFIAVMAALVEYTMKARAAVQFQTSAELMQIFSLLYTGGALATFLTQLIGGKKALEKLGLGGTLAILPAVVLVFSGVAAALGDFVSAAIAAMLLSVVSNSIFRSAYEILYTPVPPNKKRGFKQLIDVGSTRVGDAVGSAIIIGFVALQSTWAPVLAASAAAIIALVVLFTTRIVARGYVGSLEESIRSGLMAIGEGEIEDATTRATVARSIQDLDRGALLKEIAVHRARELETARRRREHPNDPSGTYGAPLIPPEQAAPLKGFLHGDDLAIAKALESGPFDAYLVPFAIRLLGSEDHALRARGFLKRNVDAITGQLADAGLDGSLPTEIRISCIDLLVCASGERSLPSLIAALSDPLFDVRVASAETLLELAHTKRLGASVKKQVLEMASAFAAAPPGGPVSDRLRSTTLTLPVTSGPGRDCPAIHVVLPGESDPRLRYLFALLAIGLEREAIAQAYRALTSGDERLRGTAIEYLENVLEGPLEAHLMPLIDGSSRLIGNALAPGEVSDEGEGRQGALLPETPAQGS